MASEPCVICAEQLKDPLEMVAAVPLQETEATPERPSLVSPLTGTVADWLMPPSAGDVMLTSGGVWSRLMVTLVVALLPRESVAVPVTTWFAPSLLTVCGLAQETGGAPPEHWKVTVTGLLFQPAAFGVGETIATICSGGKGCKVN